MRLLALATAAVLPVAVQSHFVFSKFFINGQPEIASKCIRMPTNAEHATDPLPVSSISMSNITCGMNGTQPVDRVCPVAAGSPMSFEWRARPLDPTFPIDAGHKGTCAVYMKKVDDATTDPGTGDGWFKIFQRDYNNETSQWCTEEIRAAGNHLTVTLPNDLPQGDYLVRTELLSLHESAAPNYWPQFYVGCAQMFMYGGGNAVPPNQVAIPGYVSVDQNKDALNFNIYDKPMKQYPMFGPPVYTSSHSTAGSMKIASAAGAAQQKHGLVPKQAVIESGNWAGMEIPDYGGSEDACWNASKACFDQETDCWTADHLPITGYQACQIWDNKCLGIQAQCRAGNYNGPPDKGKILTPTPDSANLPSVWPSIGGSSTSASSSTGSGSGSDSGAGSNAANSTLGSSPAPPASSVSSAAPSSSSFAASISQPDGSATSGGDTPKQVNAPTNGAQQHTSASTSNVSDHEETSGSCQSDNQPDNHQKRDVQERNVQDSSELQKRNVPARLHHRHFVGVEQ